MSKKKITKEEVEEVRHISKLQEQAEELPYAVRNLNLPDLKEGERVAGPTFIITRGAGGFITGMEIISVDGKPVAELEDEELDRLAREEVESSLYAAGIIEDPDSDGGLLG